MIALVDLGRIEQGQRVFINGGSTSVGAYAIQIAKAKGCRVVASCSGKNIDLVKSLGADEVRQLLSRSQDNGRRPVQIFDYTIAPLHLQLKNKPPSPKFDVFFECVGLPEPHLYSNSMAYLAPNGTFVSVGPQPNSIGTFVSVLYTIFEAKMRPTWLGGVPAKWT